jgi:hypothetical protein
MTCPTCGTMIPIGPLAATCNTCGFNSSMLTLDDVAEALKEGAAERKAAERTSKRSPRR